MGAVVTAVELLVGYSRASLAQRCACPDDCNCRKPWRPNYCGCQQHTTTTTEEGETDA